MPSIGTNRIAVHSQQVVKLEGDVPEKLRPYAFHGLSFDSAQGDNAIADCPWCGREGKFAVTLSTGLGRCPACNDGPENGKDFKGYNATSFIRQLWERSYETTTPDDYRELARDRKLLNIDTLVQWNLAKSITTRDWIVPGYNETGAICQLYRWINNGSRRLFYLTPTLGHKLLGVNQYSANKSKIYLAEGLWDGTAVWEVLWQVKELDNMIVPTANVDASLLADINVLAIPTSEVFFDNWLPLFKDKAVYLLCQNDHPRNKCECNKSYPISLSACPHCRSTKVVDTIQPASLNGMRRIAKLMSGTADELYYLHWGEGEEGYDLRRPSGYDPRDLICTG